MPGPHYLHQRLVVGYHGCDRKTAQKVLIDGDNLEPSANDYDWLGKGVYFWEHGLTRARQFAEEKKSRGELENPFVIGAYIHLGRCLDLTDVWATRLLGQYHEVAKAAATARGVPLPSNRTAGPGESDLLLRYLDCAVINLCLATTDREASGGFETVRGVFEEGPPAFEGAAIRQKSHVQISVRDPACILGYFRPSGYSIGASK